MFTRFKTYVGDRKKARLMKSGSKIKAKKERSAIYDEQPSFKMRFSQQVTCQKPQYYQRQPAYQSSENLLDRQFSEVAGYDSGYYANPAAVVNSPRSSVETRAVPQNNAAYMYSEQPATAPPLERRRTASISRNRYKEERQSLEYSQDRIEEQMSYLQEQLDQVKALKQASLISEAKEMQQNREDYYGFYEGQPSDNQKEFSVSDEQDESSIEPDNESLVEQSDSIENHEVISRSEVCSTNSTEKNGSTAEEHIGSHKIRRKKLKKSQRQKADDQEETKGEECKENL